MKSINPSTEQIIYEFQEMTDNEILSSIESAHNSFLSYKKTSFDLRKKLLLKTADILESAKSDYAETLTLEMGKPIKQAIAEVEKCAWVCRYYAENAEHFLANEIIATDASESFVRFDPLGVLLAVMPWNFPFWQVFRFAAPALMAGNTILLKHASNVTKSALNIEEIFNKAGFEKGIFKTLIIGSSKVKQIINHRYVKAATLTGSEFAGKSVASSCGENIKKTVMELGGSDPFIVLDNSNFDKCINAAVFARLMNNGQSCIAAKRFIVLENIYDEFLSRLIEAYEKVKIGNPLNPENDLGPIARKDLREEIIEQIQNSIEAGATIAYGGKIPEMKGYYLEPTILINISPECPAYSEEIFGPVASVIKAKTIEDAIKIANDTHFGLGASIWTKNIALAKNITPEINSGSVFINSIVKSDPRLPFGGINISGYGRELSHYGIKEFVNIKTVWVD